MAVSKQSQLERERQVAQRAAGAASKVPHGDECYSVAPVVSGTDTGKRSAVSLVRCPFWSESGRKSKRPKAFCSLLGRGDGTPGKDADGNALATSMLWDFKKNCGVNVEWPDADAATRARVSQDG